MTKRISAPSEASPFLKILGVCGVIGVGGTPDLDMAFNDGFR